MIDIPSVTTGLTFAEEGLWHSENRRDVSHPTECQDWYLAVEDNSYWFKHRAACIIECLRAYPPGGSVFDVGGGNGHVSLAMMDAGFSPVLLEPSIEAARNAQTRGISQIVCSTLEDARFELMLPAVGAFDVLEHIEDDARFLTAIHRALVNNGKLYLTVPAFRTLWSDYDTYVGHFRRYTLKSLRQRLGECGFAVDYASYLYAPLPLPIFMFRSIPSRLGIARQDLDNFRRAHASQPSLASRLVEWILSIERNRIAQRKRVPFGSSCLIVAHSVVS